MQATAISRIIPSRVSLARLRPFSFAENHAITLPCDGFHTVDLWAGGEFLSTLEKEKIMLGALGLDRGVAGRVVSWSTSTAVSLLPLLPFLALNGSSVPRSTAAVSRGYIAVHIATLSHTHTSLWHHSGPLCTRKCPAGT